MWINVLALKIVENSTYYSHDHYSYYADQIDQSYHVPRIDLHMITIVTMVIRLIKIKNRPIILGCPSHAVHASWDPRKPKIDIVQGAPEDPPAHP